LGREVIRPHVRTLGRQRDELDLVSSAISGAECGLTLVLLLFAIAFFIGMLTLVFS
jgi:hypothetical protein